MSRKWWQRRAFFYASPVVLAILGVVLLALHEWIVAAMYFVLALLLGSVAGRRYRRYAGQTGDER